MEMTSLLFGIILGAVLGAVLLYFILKSSNVSRQSFEELHHQYIRLNSDLENSHLKTAELVSLNSNLNIEIKKLQEEKQDLISIKYQLSAQNENLHILLSNQKEEISKMQDLAKIELQN